VLLRQLDQERAMTTVGRRLKHSSAALALVVLASVGSAHADELWLWNGDKLTGTVQTLERGVLTFGTSYSAMKVPWDQVASLETARQVRVTVRQLGSQVARVTPGPEGYVRLQTDAGASVDVLLNDLVSIVRSQSGVLTTARAETGFLVTSGASDISSLHLTGQATWTTALKQTTIDVAVHQSKDGGVETARDLTTMLRHRELVTDRFYAKGDLIFTNDPFRDLTLRTAPGIGIGYQVLQFGTTLLSLDGGLGYVDERHEQEPNRRYWAARETVLFEHFLFPHRLQLFHQQDGYFGLNGGENVFVRTRSGARINLMSGIIMTGELGLNYDRRPPVGQDHFDRTFAITLGYQFGF
jgi:putative salt-induced outer membrane protein YdiY